MRLQFYIFGATLLSTVFADMYLQFPGGGNNRLNEPNRHRRNQNRLFDSQNNGRFGHNQHGHYFYTGSEIDMQWTVQHSCGPDSNLNCDIILQYACEENLRDGQTTNTIPDHANECENDDCNSDFFYGMHEDHQYYQHCALRERNKGLYNADRHINGQTARYTRQEQNGARYGYECNEERDLYPYWHPTIWKDIAVFTDDLSRCDLYQQESENVKGRWYCDVGEEFLNEHYDPHERDPDIPIPIDQVSCEAINATWSFSPPHTYPNGEGMAPPVCEEAPYQRDNHHGNADSQYFAGYKWTVPENLVHNNCAVRIRYNITSDDYDAWNIDHAAKLRNDRLDEAYDDHVGKCYGVTEGPARISGYDLSSLDFDANSTLEINPRPWDQRIVLTRNHTESNIWRVQTANHGAWQWFGWKDWEFRYRKIKVSFKVKFAEKPTQGHYGMKIFGNLINDWVEEAPLNEWYDVEIDYEVPGWGDGEHIIMIFDGVSVDLEVQDMQLCVIDELKDYNPFASMQDSFGFDPREARERGYENRNDAKLQIFERIPMRLRSAYNTDQLGRVFEDRSHKIKFIQLPEDIKEDMTLYNKKFYNLNARGKIGNNVEVYPAFEYDFVPSRLEANVGDYVHIQWSGSTTNDHGNDHSQLDSNGNTIHDLRGQDRHNMVAIDSMNAIRPTSDLERISSLFGLDGVDSMKLAFNGVTGGDNEYMQSAGAYFDLGPRKLTTEGKHMFMSSINNSAGVRNQKGKIIVT